MDMIMKFFLLNFGVRKMVSEPVDSITSDFYRVFHFKSSKNK